MGPNWSRESGAAASPDDRVDWVHKELRWALEARKPLLPIMIAGQRMDQLTLPGDLTPIKQLQSCTLDNLEFDRSMAEVQQFLSKAP